MSLCEKWYEVHTVVLRASMLKATRSYQNGTKEQVTFESERKSTFNIEQSGKR